jgi:ABC-type nitrate/sulfonate/bicarbonate transport system ATPase subunit
MVTHSIEEAILVGERVLVLGANQSGLIEDIDVRAPALKDRYAPEFLQLQRRLEQLIDDDRDPDRAAA